MILFAGQLLAFASIANAKAPDTSLATLPVAYYGASWSRTDANIEMLSKQRIVVLLQEEGDCWMKCCPNHLNTSFGNCNSRENASLNPGCDSSCDQHGKQDAIFLRVKAAAKAAGRTAPHCMIYMNAVYDWPFNAEHGDGKHGVDLVDIYGNPHAEVCDPGIYPSYFWDFGREAGRNAFLNGVQKYVVDGAADGVFLDCFAQIPMHCDHSGNCTALRNHNPANRPSIVSQAQFDAYTRGKNETLSKTAQLIAAGTGGAFAAFTYDVQHKKDPNGANMAPVNFWNEVDPNELIKAITSVRKNGYRYILILHGYSFPTRDDQEKSLCSEYQVAAFLLAMEEGCFLACFGWSDDFSRPLGNPEGSAKIVNGIMSRRFASGVEVEWMVGTKNTTIRWSTNPSPTALTLV